MKIYSSKPPQCTKKPFKIVDININKNLNPPPQTREREEKTEKEKSHGLIPPFPAMFPKMWVQNF